MKTTSLISKVYHQCMRKDPVRKESLKTILNRLTAKEINPKNVKKLKNLYDEKVN